MIRSMLVFVGISLCLVGPSPASAQTTTRFSDQTRPPNPTPPRDPSAVAAATGSISGRVIDAATGTPLRRASVRVNGSALRNTRTTSTDADGRYQIADLPPGTYTLASGKQGYLDTFYGQRTTQEPPKTIPLAARQAVESIDFALFRGAVITGRVLDEFGEPLSDAQVQALRMTYTANGRQPTPGGRPFSSNDIGEFRIYGLVPGDYVIAAMFRNFNFNAGDTTDRSGYAPTYYPATPNVVEAQPLHVGAGQTLNDIAIMLSPTRVAQVSGVVFDAQGQPVKQGNVQVQQTSVTSMIAGFGAQIRPDGTFVVNGLPPGDYRFVANLGAFQQGVPPEQSMTTVSVNGVDVTNVRLDVPPKLLLGGSIVFDPALAERPNLSSLRVLPMPRGTTVVPAPIVASAVRSDLTFEIRTLAGTVGLAVQGLPATWMIRQIRSHGLDLTDEIVVDRDMTDLEVELTNRVPQVTGVVTNARGEPAPGVVAILFPQEIAIRRRINPRTARTDNDGKFVFRAMRPGDYYLAAVTQMENGRALDPEYQESIAASALRVSLSDGEAKTMDVRVLEER
jgi:protocatechuate 3,4-dioxygenase beta subunit